MNLEDILTFKFINFHSIVLNSCCLQYHGYKTYTAHAIIKTVRDDFNGPTNRYPMARRVMILLTDGKADDKR